MLSCSLILQESFIHSHRPHLGLIRRKLLFALSDQQIIYGIGIQAVGLAQIGQLVPYHFFIVWMMSLLSTAVHNSALLVLVGNLHSDRVLRWMRQILMLVNLVLGCVFGVCMLQVVTHDLENSTLPTSCAWTSVKGTRSNTENKTLSFVGTIAVIAGNFVVFTVATWFLHDRKQKFFRWIQLASILAMIAIAAAAIVRVFVTSQAFGNPPVTLADSAEKQWTFSTLVTLLMLFLPVLTVLEIYRGEVHVNTAYDKEG